MKGINNKMFSNLNYISNASDANAFKDQIKSSMDAKALEKINDMKKEIASNILNSGN